MKSPEAFKKKLQNYWLKPKTRTNVVFDTPDEFWPINIIIGKPKPSDFSRSLAELKQHLEKWKNLKIGEVLWENIKYQSLSESISVPVKWILHKPKDWLAACNDEQITQEYKHLKKILSVTNKKFWAWLIQNKNRIISLQIYEVKAICELAQELEPNYAQGQPLRTLTFSNIEGIDSKFFEKHRYIISKLLDIQYNNQASEIGLEEFLGALRHSEHWLLMADLDGNLLPFKYLRVTDKALMQDVLLAKNILIVENEQCVYSLPKLSDTIAILGAGLNLNWLQSDTFNNKNLAYWGDIDSWGMYMLGKAKFFRANIRPLLMTLKIYEKHLDVAVDEPVTKILTNMDQLDLSEDEYLMFEYLKLANKGRLEQEHIDKTIIYDVLLDWHKSIS